MKMMTFGKYKGKTVDQVIHINPRYIQWAEENVSFFTLSDSQKRNLEEELEMIDHNREVKSLMKKYGMNVTEAEDFIEYDYPEYF
jgi:hypothetical protein